MHKAFQDTPKNAYLRNRPFLVVEYYLRPSTTGRNTPTTRKGWMDDTSNVSQEEVPSIVDAVRDQHLCSAAVIIDVVRNQVVKSRFDDSDENILAHFRKKYAAMIERGNAAWREGAATR